MSNTYKWATKTRVSWKRKYGCWPENFCDHNVKKVKEMYMYLSTESVQTGYPVTTLVALLQIIIKVKS